MAERFVHSIVRFTLRYRWFSLAWLAAITLFFAHFALSVEIYSQFSDLLPQAHPYIKAYNHFAKTFGSANTISLSIEVKNGDIFNAHTLQKVKYATEKVDDIDGVDHYAVMSVTDVKVRKLTATSGGLIVAQPVMPDDIPTDP